MGFEESGTLPEQVAKLAFELGINLTPKNSTPKKKATEKKATKKKATEKTATKKGSASFCSATKKGSSRHLSWEEACAIALAQPRYFRATARSR